MVCSNQLFGVVGMMSVFGVKEDCEKRNVIGRSIKKAVRKASGTAFRFIIILIRHDPHNVLRLIH